MCRPEPVEGSRRCVCAMRGPTQDIGDGQPWGRYERVRSKKFAGELCVYCNSKSSGAPDHVFAREFFLVNQRGNLPQVPACQDCNNAKSRLEHYLTALLPFGGRHADAPINLESMVPKRLAKNARLHRALGRNKSTIWNSAESGLSVPQMALPIDGQLEKLFEFITKGLLWHHWKVRLTGDHAVVAGLSPTIFLTHFLRCRPIGEWTLLSAPAPFPIAVFKGRTILKPARGNFLYMAAWKLWMRPKRRRAPIEKSARPRATSELPKRLSV
jgi:hypothetical protein